MEILIRNEQQLLLIDETKIREIIGYILENELNSSYKREVSIFITNDKTIAHYNEKYRGIEGPTDVLSFPYDDEDEIIGDIIISTETVKRNASEYKIPLLKEFYIVLIHALLHLCGYTHDKIGDRNTMFEKQEKYLNIFWKDT